MFKNALLSIKKNIGKTILLFVIMVVIANLVIAGLSIKSATSKSIASVRQSLGSEVTLSYNTQNMMNNREQGQALDEVVSSITVDMADQLKDLDYVESYNYTLSVSATSDDVDPVETTASSDDSDTSTDDNMQMPDSSDDSSSDRNQFMDSNDFTVIGNTTMANLSDFTDENYVLISGKLLTEDDAGTTNCVIESNLASDNDLEVGDTFSVTTTNSDDEEITVTLTIVGIFEIESSSEIGGMMSNRQNPMNYIYVDISTAQTLNDSTTDITSASYYLDDPDNIEAFIALAESETDIDFDTYTLDANDQIYQSSISSLEDMEQFANIFLWVVVGAGCAILCLILMLTMRSRFYEFGVFLSLGQSKLKIMLQQLIEVLVIAVVAFALSLGTGKMVSNVISGMLESTQSNQSEMVMEIPNNIGDGLDSFDTSSDSDSDSNSRGSLFDQAMTSPEDTELDVSMTASTAVQLAGITGLICVVSVLLPSIYILRLSPREILVKKEG
ncbi:MAG: ABC transporter permease [Erysipelotrichaceae bacterium]|nr:ABC transporter permease [Erysipelotrichaceae bacterium]